MFLPLEVGGGRPEDVGSPDARSWLSMELGKYIPQPWSVRFLHGRSGWPKSGHFQAFVVLRIAESFEVKNVPVCPCPGPGRGFAAWVPGGCLQNILVWPDACSLCCLALSRACLRCCRCFSAQAAHLVWPGIAAFGQSLQRPSDLAFCRFSWARSLRYSLRSGVWLLCRSYSCRSWCLASTSAGVGSTRGFGSLALGIAFGRGFLTFGFLGDFCTGGFFVFWGPGFFRVGNWKESIKSCGLGGIIPVAETLVVASSFEQG